MARKWTKIEENLKRKELFFLYVKKNKTITEIGKILNLAENSVYDRLVRLDIQTLRNKKAAYNNTNHNIIVPKRMTSDLAEFMGIMLGDGHITPTQVTVTLGTKERQYAEYVQKLMGRLFGVEPKIGVSKAQCLTVYLGSTVLVKWLLQNHNLVYNKVKNQVDIPAQSFLSPVYMRATLRGLFDTDGSVYALGGKRLQMSFTNKSQRLLLSCKKMLENLGFHPSAVSCDKVYLTRKIDIIKYLKEIRFANSRHNSRVVMFDKIMGGSYSGNYA